MRKNEKTKPRKAQQAAAKKGSRRPMGKLARAHFVKELFDRLGQVSALRDTVILASRADEQLLGYVRLVETQAYPMLEGGNPGFAKQMLVAMGEYHLAFTRIRMAAMNAIPEADRSGLPK